MQKNSVSVLIVEDETPKFLHIKKYLMELCGYLDIKHARSVSSGLDELEDDLPDLLILDMSLPTFDISDNEGGGRPQGFGGIEILRSMLLEDMQCPTIVITGFPAFQKDSGETVGLGDLSNELQREFSAFLKGTLHFNSTFSEWRIQLQQILKKEGLLK
jgi:CheY-like chemotaxis protein